MRLAESEVAELRRLDAEATPGPWDSVQGGDGVEEPRHFVCVMRATGTAADFDENNSALIAATRNALPRLLDEREALLCELAEAVRLVRASAYHVDLNDVSAARRLLDRHPEKP